jgi:nitrogen PTS system EIIA component
MDLSDYINERTVFFSTEKHKHRILDELIEKAFALGYVQCAHTFKTAIQRREAERSTGIGGGVAIPHARSADIEKYFILTAVLKCPLEWDAIDHNPVSLVFLIGGPANDQMTYLKLLSSIMSVVKDPSNLNVIINTRKPAELLEVFI